MQIPRSNKSSVLPLLPPLATHSIAISRSQWMSSPTGCGGRARASAQKLHFRRGVEQAGPPSISISDSSESDADDRDIDGRHNYDPVITSVAFNEYYKEQGIVSPEEWDTFIEVLQTPLPAAFRVSSSSKFCAEILQQLETDFRKSIHPEHTEENNIDAIAPLPWYPDNLAWQFNFSRRQLRKDHSLERFHEFLKIENEIGNITRQEAVSMIPPLLLDVQPEHLVLDMCAAPGSKTYQLLDIIHQLNCEGSLPHGMIVANDLIAQRCDHLIHKMKRMNTANLVVTNHEAQCFPGCLFSKTYSYEMSNELEKHPHQLLFDRVLCDVPCSGDGTLRKAPNIWRRWNSATGNGLHSLQLQIAMRGIALLKIGGRMVYSTCSMNPVENEAVVSEILRRCGGSVELVDISGKLPQLIHRPGLSKWKVHDKNRWFSTFEDVPDYRRGGIVRSMFPYRSTKVALQQVGSHPTVNSDAVNKACELPLECCMRIMPHDQNGGAFFIAVFQKLARIPVINKKSVSQEEDLPSMQELPHLSEDTNLLEVISSEEKDKVGERSPKWKGVDPIVFLEDESIIDNIRSFYGIDDSFPLRGHLVTRNSDSNCGKRIYYTSKSVKDLLELNYQAGQQLKIPYVGLKMFERKKSKQGTLTCPFRISSEGLALILPYMTKQVLCASEADFRLLLQYKSVKFANFVDREFGDGAWELMPGGCVIVLDKGSEALKDWSRAGESTMAIGCWKGKTSLNLMVNPLECQEMLQRLLSGEPVRRG
ncbi:hypothetical protein SAY86_014780 [Trapa natans]|uniref:SAM-dependent MTase RsmB/NOP-type domain-containing protein n=1 Tax=Trapa natans TaxID=22666 RepID=A0AAN7QGL0_TRANT|nr:hypothetical protein SAY86_014780 [Trapa natans]